MKNLVVFLALLGATTAATAPSVRAQASSAGAQQPPTLASVLSMQYGIVEQEVVSANIRSRPQTASLRVCALSPTK